MPAPCGEFESKLRALSSGVRSGVDGTPHLFINGQRWEGPATADVLILVLGSLIGM